MAVAYTLAECEDFASMRLRAPDTQHDRDMLLPLWRESALRVARATSSLAGTAIGEESESGEVFEVSFPVEFSDGVGDALREAMLLFMASWMADRWLATIFGERFRQFASVAADRLSDISRLLLWRPEPVRTYESEPVVMCDDKG